MNADFITPIALVGIFATLMAMFIAIISQNANLSKKIDDLRDRMINVEAEIKILNSKFDGLEEKYVATNKRVDEAKDDIKEIRTENKTLINKVLDVLTQKTATL